MAKKALLLDVSYQDNEKSVIRLYVKEKGKKAKWIIDDKFSPYLYVTVKGNKKEKMSLLKAKVFGMDEQYKILDVEDMATEHNDEAVLKVSFSKVSQLIEARKEINELGLNKFEYDIPFSKRYLIDTRLEPGNWIEYESEEKNGAEYLKKVKAIDGEFNPDMVCFDLETWCGKKFGVGLEPIIMVSIATEKETKMLSYDTKETKGLELVADEKNILLRISEALNKADVIVTYNGDNFDLPYIKDRAKKLGFEIEINGEKINVRRHGLDNAVKLKGKQHIDAYQIMKLMQRTGSVNTVKLDLETVSQKVFGIWKEKVMPLEINQHWKTGKGLARLVRYNKEDADTTLRLAKEFLPLFIEISKLTSQTLQDTTRETTSQMVEDLLLKEAHVRGVIAPNKPYEPEIRMRTNNPIKGAFVKEPLAGLHEKIAVLDFASLYPSIIISHNISPEKLNCEHKECKKNLSPDGTWFCTKEKGLFPEILEQMLKQRLKLKAEYKKKKKEGIDDKVLFAKQWALKIILNSTYGYLGYPRARWYSRECASATTAWARKYIAQTITNAEIAGFGVLYGDTDSNFLLMNDKTKQDVENFLEKVNKDLPETMELELDGFYKRGLFVTKKEGGAAKKKYALIDEKDNLKIVGFEYVRRDWCNLAKETQRKVIELVLAEGKPEKAAEYVKGIIKELKEGKVKKEELAIITMLKRNLKDYDSIGPHTEAARKAIARGKNVDVGSLLSFIITRNGKTISEKSELEEFVEEGNYDADYYITNQVMPAVIKILRELGYSEEDLIQGGKQSGLGAWS